MRIKRTYVEQIKVSELSIDVNAKCNELMSQGWHYHTGFTTGGCSHAVILARPLKVQKRTKDAITLERK